MAFIDSRLAQSRSEGLEREREKALLDAGINTSSQPTAREPGRDPGKGREDVKVQRQPAAMGKLMEIDLGDEARSRNVERTEQARKRLDGEDVAEEGKPAKKVKVRLGPDGKPWRSKKKRRGSDDVKRDKMVEDVLRENRRRFSFPSLSFPFLPFSFPFPSFIISPSRK